jgi:hypothetical protein
VLGVGRRRRESAVELEEDAGRRRSSGRRGDGRWPGRRGQRSSRGRGDSPVGVRRPAERRRRRSATRGQRRRGRLKRAEAAAARARQRRVRRRLRARGGGCAERQRAVVGDRCAERRRACGGRRAGGAAAGQRAQWRVQADQTRIWPDPRNSNGSGQFN